MRLTECTPAEIGQLRGAINQAGSRLIQVSLHVEEDAAYLCARASSPLSVAQWAKEFGIARLQPLVVQCTDGMVEAMRKCRAEWGLALESEESYNSRPRATTGTTTQQGPRESSGQKRGSDTEDEGEPTRMECEPVQARTLHETLLSHQFGAYIGVVAPKLAWEKFNQQAAFWYVRNGLDFYSEQHMPTVFQAMYDHTQSHVGWREFVKAKEVELGTSTRRAGVDPKLLRWLLEQRVEAKGKCSSEQVWAKFEAWALEMYPQGGRDTLHTLIQAMCTHPQSDIEWRRHAVKQNRYYYAGLPH